MHTAAKLVKEEELVRLLLCGHMLKECAAYMHLNYQTVRTYAKQPHFLQMLKDKSASIYERVDEELRSSKEGLLEKLERYSEDALEEMMELAKTEKGMVKLKACQDIMDRNPAVSRQKRVEATTNHNFLDALTLVHVAGVAREVDKKQLTEGNNEQHS